MTTTLTQRRRSAGRAFFVRQNQLLTAANLRDEAARLIKKKGLTQEEVADLIGALQPHVGGAQGSDYVTRASINARIIEALHPKFVAEREVCYRVVERSDA